MDQSKQLKIGKVTIPMGQTVDVHLEVSERYTGEPVSLPIRVIRGTRPGPCVFVTAGIHGDELNGVGIVHDLAFGRRLVLTRLSGFDPLDNFFRVLSSQFPRRGEPEMGLNSL